MWCYPDVMGQVIFEGRPFETDERSFVARFLQSGMTFFDVGAHHGLYSLLASKRVGKEGQVYAFEPVPQEFRRLSRNLNLNRCRNVVAEQIAMSRFQGEADMYIVHGRESGCNSLRLPGRDVTTTTSLVKVALITIDKYVQKMRIGAIDLIKIDAEGGELDILKGAESVLTENFRPLMLCEMEDRRTAPWGYPAREIIDWLARRGFEWFEPTKNGLTRHQKCENYDCDGLVAVPKERLGEVESLLVNERRG